MNLVQITPSIQSEIFMTGAGNLNKNEEKTPAIQLKCERIQGAVTSSRGTEKLLRFQFFKHTSEKAQFSSYFIMQFWT